MKITYKEWISQIDNCVFYEDLRATLDGMAIEMGDRSCINRLCQRHGYQFNWIDYSLEPLNDC